MASIYRREKKGDVPNKPTGSWRVEIRKRGQPRIIRDFRTKAQSMRWAAATETQLDAGTYVDTTAADSTIFVEVLHQYMEKQAIHNRGYGVEITNIGELSEQLFSPKIMSEIKVSDIASFRDAQFSRGLSAGTVKRRFTLLSSIFNYAILEMDMKHLLNPVRSVRLPRVEDEREVIFVGDQEREYFEAAQRYGRGVFIDVARFAIETTMRKAEMIGLDAVELIDGVNVKRRRHEGVLWHMVHLDIKIIKLPASIAKTGHKRDVPLSPQAIELIKKQLPKNGRPNPKAKVFDISPDGVRNAHNRTIKAAGIVGFWFRDLRHVGTTKWAKKLPLLQLMRVTGHKDPRMLARYYNQEATEVADMMAACSIQDKPH